MLQNPQNLNQNMSQNLSQNIPQNLPQNLPHNTLNPSLSQNMTQNPGQLSSIPPMQMQQMLQMQQNQAQNHMYNLPYSSFPSSNPPQQKLPSNDDRADQSQFAQVGGPNSQKPLTSEDRQKVIHRIALVFKECSPQNAPEEFLTKQATQYEEQVFNQTKTKDEYLKQIARKLYHIRKKNSESGQPSQPMNQPPPVGSLPGNPALPPNSQGQGFQTPVPQPQGPAGPQGNQILSQGQVQGQVQGSLPGQPRGITFNRGMPPNLPNTLQNGIIYSHQTKPPGPSNPNLSTMNPSANTYPPLSNPTHVLTQNPMQSQPQPILTNQSLGQGQPISQGQPANGHFSTNQPYLYSSTQNQNLSSASQNPMNRLSAAHIPSNTNPNLPAMTTSQKEESEEEQIKKKLQHLKQFQLPLATLLTEFQKHLVNTHDPVKRSSIEAFVAKLNSMHNMVATPAGSNIKLSLAEVINTESQIKGLLKHIESKRHPESQHATPNAGAGAIQQGTLQPGVLPPSMIQPGTLQSSALPLQQSSLQSGNLQQNILQQNSLQQNPLQPGSLPLQQTGSMQNTLQPGSLPPGTLPLQSGTLPLQQNSIQPGTLPLQQTGPLSTQQNSLQPGVSPTLGLPSAGSTNGVNMHIPGTLPQNPSLSKLPLPPQSLHQQLTPLPNKITVRGGMPILPTSTPTGPIPVPRVMAPQPTPGLNPLSNLPTSQGTRLPTLTSAEEVSRLYTPNKTESPQLPISPSLLQGLPPSPPTTVQLGASPQQHILPHSLPPSFSGVKMPVSPNAPIPNKPTHPYASSPSVTSPSQPSVVTTPSPSQGPITSPTPTPSPALPTTPEVVTKKEEVATSFEANHSNLNGPLPQANSTLSKASVQGELGSKTIIDEIAKTMNASCAENIKRVLDTFQEGDNHEGYGDFPLWFHPVKRQKISSENETLNTIDTA
jgi:hypothetical protein